MTLQALITCLNGQTGWHPSLIFRVSHLKGPLAGFLFCSVHQVPEGIDLINVNIPANPINEEFEVVRLGKRMYVPIIDKRLDPREKPYYWIGGEPYDSDKPGTDGYELRKSQKTTLTPLKIDLTSDISLLKEWIS